MSSSNIERLLKLKNRMQKLKSGEWIGPQQEFQDSKTPEKFIAGKEPSSLQFDDEITCLDDDVICIKDGNKSESVLSAGVRQKNRRLKSLKNRALRSINTSKSTDLESEIVRIESGTNCASQEYSNNHNLKMTIKPIKPEIGGLAGSQGVCLEYANNRNLKQEMKAMIPGVEIVDIKTGSKVFRHRLLNKCNVEPETVTPEVEILEIESDLTRSHTSNSFRLKQEINSMKPDVTVLKNESGSSLAGCNISNNFRVKQEIKTIITPCVEMGTTEDRSRGFLHFTLDNLHTYLSDHIWIEIVKKEIVKKYDVSPNRYSNINVPLTIFFDTVNGLKVNDDERKFAQLAIEALYLKTLYRKSGVLSITAWFMEKISSRMVTMELMTLLYLIHVIISTEKRLFNSNDGIQLYRDTFQNMKLGQRFREIVIRAPAVIKKELYSLRLRWNSLLSNQILKGIDKDDFWMQQGLNSKYMQYKTEMYSRSLMRAAGLLNGNHTIKSEMKGLPRQPQSNSDSALKPKRRRRATNSNVKKARQLVEVVTVDDNSNDDGSSDVEIVQEFEKKTKKLNQKRRRKAEKRKDICVDVGEKVALGSLNEISSTTKEKLDDGEIIITSWCSLAPLVNAEGSNNATTSSASSPSSNNSAISKISEKTDLVLINGQLVPKLDGKCKKSVKELQQMLMRKKGAPRKKANNLNAKIQNGISRIITPKKNKNLRQVQVTNVMSKEFVDNLLTPTLANFEIVYGDDGTAQTKFTHLA